MGGIFTRGNQDLPERELAEVYGLTLSAGEGRDVQITIKRDMCGTTDELRDHLKELVMATYWTEKEIIDLHEKFLQFVEPEAPLGSKRLAAQLLEFMGVKSKMVSFLCQGAEEWVPFPVVLMIGSVFMRGSKEEKLSYLFSTIDQDCGGSLSESEMERAAAVAYRLNSGERRRCMMSEKEHVYHVREQIFQVVAHGSDSVSFREFIENSAMIINALQLNEIFGDEEEDEKEDTPVFI